MLILFVMHEEIFMKLTRIAAFVTAALATLPTFASTLDVTYTATVSDALGTSTNSGYADGAVITGGFLINSVTDAVTGSYLGTLTVPPSTATGNPVQASLSSTDAIYTQGLFASGGDPSNNSITVDFSALNSFTGSDPVAFLQQGAATLAAQIDFTGAASAFPSTITYYSGDASGNNITQVDGYLDSVSVTPVPLPATPWFMLTGVSCLSAFARRRKTICWSI
jgi:hypothetical protein